MQHACRVARKAYAFHTGRRQYRHTIKRKSDCNSGVSSTMKHAACCLCLVSQYGDSSKCPFGKRQRMRVAHKNESQSTIPVSSILLKLRRFGWGVEPDYQAYTVLASFFSVWRFVKISVRQTAANARGARLVGRPALLLQRGEVLGRRTGGSHTANRHSSGRGYHSTGTASLYMYMRYRFMLDV